MSGKLKAKTKRQHRLPQPSNGSQAYERIYAVVRRIPRGRVATYGQVAALAGFPGRARQVGYALHALPPRAHIPWQRVINALGRISRRSEPGPDYRQRVLLESEGIKVDASDRISLHDFQWRPRAAGKTARKR